MDRITLIHQCIDSQGVEVHHETETTMKGNVRNALEHLGVILMTVSLVGAQKQITIIGHLFHVLQSEQRTIREEHRKVVMTLLITIRNHRKNTQILYV